MSAWRFKATTTFCETEWSGADLTSYNLRCGQVDPERRWNSSRRRLDALNPQVSNSSWPRNSAQLAHISDVCSTPSDNKSDIPYHNTLWQRPNSCQRSRTSTLSKPRFQVTKQPSACRLPMSIRVKTCILYVIVFLLLCSTTLAAPAHAYSSHSRLHVRQAIPDRTGNTGNIPGLFTPSSSPLPTSTSTPTPTPTLTPTSSSSPTSTSDLPPPPPKSTSLIPGNNGNTNIPPGELGLNPNAPSTVLALTSPTFPLSTGAIAGIAGGSAVLLTILIAIAICAYRRRRVAVTEIPIRRSRLASRLGFRVFGDKPASRSASRNTNRDSTASKKSDGTAVDKEAIGRPKPSWVENGFLSVPKPGFLKEKEIDEEDDRAPWVDKETISKPRPGRPRSAEPLGRLSGMGLGMGYLK